MSLVKFKKVWILFSSLYVPVFVPLRFVEVMVILLAEFNLDGLILFWEVVWSFFRERCQVHVGGWLIFCCISWAGICSHIWGLRWHASW